MSIEELQIPELLRTAKSVGCRRLHLRTKSDRRMEVKLLSAKIKNLKNQCRTLREESQTDRQILSNLMTATNDLEDKTNQKIEECKVISNELLEKQSEILSTGMSQTLDQFHREYTKTLSEIFIGQNPESNQNQEKEEKEVSEFSLGEFQCEMKTQTIFNSFKELTKTPFVKQIEKQQESDQMSNVTPNRSRSDSLDSKISNSNSLSDWKNSTRLHRKNSSLRERSKVQINPKTENVFKMYIYAVIITIVLTIVFFKMF